jgi:hypothetical protein
MMKNKETVSEMAKAEVRTGFRHPYTAATYCRNASVIR